jgi:hypothetical protein
MKDFPKGVRPAYPGSKMALSESEVYMGGGDIADPLSGEVCVEVGCPYPCA